MDPFSAVTPGNRWSPGHGAVPRPPGCWIWASEQSCLIGLYCSRLFWKLPQLPRSTPPRPAPAFCQRELGPCGSSLGADAGRGSCGQGLTLGSQTDLPGAQLAGNSPRDCVE